MILSERVFGIRCLYIPAIVASRLATIAGIYKHRMPKTRSDNIIEDLTGCF